MTFGVSCNWSVETEFPIEFEVEDDGRWVAGIVHLPGVMNYGATREEAATRVQVLASKVIESQQPRDL